jgi:hypothetical protein
MTDVPFAAVNGNVNARMRRISRDNPQRDFGIFS